MTFYTLVTAEKVFDLPKDMPIPQIGSKISVDGNNHFIVESVRYSVISGELFEVSVWCINQFKSKK